MGIVLLAQNKYSETVSTLLVAPVRVSILKPPTFNFIGVYVARI